MEKLIVIISMTGRSPSPDVSTLFDYTYATPVPNDSRRLPGQPLFEPLPAPEPALGASA